MLLSAGFDKLYTAVGGGRQTGGLTCRRWRVPGPNGRVSWPDSSSGRPPVKVGGTRRRGSAWRRSLPSRRAPGRRLRPRPTIDWRTRPRPPSLWIRSRPGNSSFSSPSTRRPKRLPVARPTATPAFPVYRRPHEKEWGGGARFRSVRLFLSCRLFTGRSDVLARVFR